MLIATPISSLFKQEPEVRKIIDISDCFECRDISFGSTIPRQAIYHSHIELIHKWTEKEIEKLASIRSAKKELELISFHATSCYSNSVIIDGVFHPDGNEYSREDMIVNSKNNIKTVKNIFKNKIEIAVENNNYFPTDAYKRITDSDFISYIVNENKIAFLFDIAHANVTAYNKKINFDYYINGLPLHRCIQIHISQHGVKNGVAYDAHETPEEQLYSFIRNFLAHNRKIKYLTIEYYKSVDQLFLIISRIRRIAASL